MSAPSRFSFIVCEDVRNEEGKKISLMGVLPGTMMISREGYEKARAEGKGVKIPQLCFFMHLAGGSGKFQANLRMIGPDGKTAREEDFGVVEISEEEPAALMLKVTPFTISATGTYKMELALDNNKYEGQFRIEVGEASKA